ncbi:hypothetical protein DFW101_2953 [Solidesulfovibrio carbinoliphilus subsp. oakridgensis]|uniref:Uncharacterized protein n=1 Tax=Solidesulfovibrio carbinoliphilus subsp. oakridgensis TaxID=694327 RepID=G7Q5F3_9BACT|nr:hypothetical protein [Solidesulfovibrio carbinoliphilus]EHJ48954.1 hypothetical protein DFW101_2953 [Solidesulfovibrio carbinoliphilus subsp. oakridgensis]
MNFRDNITKIKNAAKSAKDTVVDFVSEEVVDFEIGLDDTQKKKRQLKQWVVAAGTACVSIVATVMTKGGYDSTTSRAADDRRSKNLKNAYLNHRNKHSHPKKKIESRSAINSKDTSLDNLIRASSTIESILENKGGTGRGLHEKASSVEDKISDGSVNSIRFIASVRNKLVHEGPDTVTPEIKRDYLSACDRVLKDIKSS